MQDTYSIELHNFSRGTVIKEFVVSDEHSLNRLFDIRKKLEDYIALGPEEQFKQRELAWDNLAPRAPDATSWIWDLVEKWGEFGTLTNIARPTSFSIYAVDHNGNKTPAIFE